MKKHLTIPVCLLLAGLAFGVVFFIQNLQTVPRSEAARIASEYSIAELQDYWKNDGSIEEMVLTSDLFTVFSGKRQWIVAMKDMWIWIHIDAFSGEIIGVDKDFHEYSTPTSLPPFYNVASFFVVIPYAGMVVFSCLYGKEKRYRVLFWASVVVFMMLLLLYKIVAAMLFLVGSLIFG